MSGIQYIPAFVSITMKLSGKRWLWNYKNHNFRRKKGTIWMVHWQFGFNEDFDLNHSNLVLLFFITHCYNPFIKLYNPSKISLLLCITLTFSSKGYQHIQHLWPNVRCLLPSSLSSTLIYKSLHNKTNRKRNFIVMQSSISCQ